MKKLLLLKIDNWFTIIYKYVSFSYNKILILKILSRISFYFKFILKTIKWHSVTCKLFLKTYILIGGRILLVFFQSVSQVEMSGEGVLHQFSINTNHSLEKKARTRLKMSCHIKFTNAFSALCCIIKEIKFVHRRLCKAIKTQRNVENTCINWMCKKHAFNQVPWQRHLNFKWE